jgi:salicylate hydroxylase
MHLILVGAGIGGLTAALAAPPGVRVTLLEQAPALVEVGAGIQLSPNAMRVLNKLGLGPELEAIGFEPHAAEVREAEGGRLLLRQPMGTAARARWGAPYLHLHRADLQAVLMGAVLSRHDQTLSLGERVVKVESRGDKVTVSTSSGSRIEGDAVVGCDGLHSRVRQALWAEGKPRFTRQTAWRGLVEADCLPAGLIPPVAAVWTGAGRHFVHYYVRGGTLVNFVAVAHAARPTVESWSREGDPVELARAFGDWPPPVAALTQAADKVWRWDLYDRPPLPAWSKGRISLLGDAAHPMLPYLAQGAAMAIEDAAVLGEALRTFAGVPEALKAFEARRRDRTARVQSAARRNAALFHLPGPLARASFGAAGLADRLSRDDGARRFDWLYGGG